MLYSAGYARGAIDAGAAMRRGTAVRLGMAVLAVSAAMACGADPPAPAAPPVPQGCERYLTVPEVERAMGRPVRAVLSDNGEDCLFQLGTPEDGASLAIILDLGPHPEDVPGLRAVDLDALPPHGERISSYYEVADGRETLVALSGAAFYELIATSEPTGGGTALADLRPKVVGLARTLASRL
jgi:hypothetical protein